MAANGFSALGIDMSLPCSIADLEALRKERLAACNWQSCHKLRRRGFWCWRCRRLQQQLCRWYHQGDAACELVGRITYEVVFDILDVQAVAAAQWLNAGCRWQSDCGHTLRLLRLGQVVVRSEKVGWLRVDEALKNARV